MSSVCVHTRGHVAGHLMEVTTNLSMNSPAASDLVPRPLHVTIVSTPALMTHTQHGSRMGPSTYRKNDHHSSPYAKIDGDEGEIDVDEGGKTYSAALSGFPSAFLPMTARQ